VSAEAYLNKIEILPEHDFLIISCDGLWDKLTYDEAVEFVANAKSEGKQPEEVAQLLVKDALERGTMDNVTAIVVYFSPSSGKPKKPKSEVQSPKKEQTTSEEDEENSDTMDVYEFLKAECEKKQKLKEQEDAVKRNEQLKMFNLPPSETIIEEYTCVLEKKLNYPGVLWLTQHFICFYSTRFGKKTLEQITMNDIVSVDKQKTILMSNAIRIVARDGKKLLVSWKQSTSRDQVFTKILDAINNLEENGTNTSTSSANGKTEKHKHQKGEDEKKDTTSTKTESSTKTSTKTSGDLTDSKAYSTWSRFED